MTTSDAEGHDVGAGSRWWLIPVVLVVLVAGLLAGFVGVGLRAGESPPADGSAPVGFARDMQTHHAQAVEMAMLVRDSTEDPEIRLLAYDIALTQQHQIGQMYAWLEQWGLPQTSSRPPMAWMAVHGSGHDGAGHDSAGQDGAGHGNAGSSASSPPALMPGMAAREELIRLASLDGREAEALFLELMIDHHIGGVEMARAVLERTAPDYVRRLARTMVEGQSSEITVMEKLLQARAR